MTWNVARLDSYNCKVQELTAKDAKSAKEYGEFETADKHR